MKAYRVHIAINARAKFNGGGFSFLLWQLAAYRQSKNGLTLAQTLHHINPVTL